MAYSREKGYTVPSVHNIIYPFFVFMQTTGYVVIPHVKFGFLLLLILGITLVILAMFRFRLNKWTAVCFVLLYCIFLVYAFLQELLTVCDKGRHC